MNEMSYEQALEEGIEPIHYRNDRLQELGAGRHEGRLDALVWAKRQPALQALITLDTEVKIQIIGFQRHTRKGLPEYLGLRQFYPGERVAVIVDVGIRGGLRPTVISIDPREDAHHSE